MKMNAKLIALFAGMTLCISQTCAAQSLREMVISRDLAERHGLDRSWIGRVQVDPARGKVAYVTHDNGTLFAQTTLGAVHAIDGETGRTLWVSYVGKSDYAVLRPGAAPPYDSPKQPGYVAAINGSTMYLLARDTGKILDSVSLRGAPSAGPTLAQGSAYVPLANGLLQGFNLKDLSRKPAVYHGSGYSLSPAIICKRVVSWVTTEGFVYAAEQETLSPAFRFETGRSIEAPLAFSGDLILAASRDGYVYAITERGTGKWEFSTGEQIVRQPVAIGESVYVTPEGAGLFCLDLTRGKDRWWNPQLSRFVAASPTRVYGFDAQQNMVVVDAQSGATVDAFPSLGFDVPVLNTENDRVYLATSTGLILCLHERSLTSPAVHSPPLTTPRETTEPEAEPAAPAESSPTTEADDDPFN